MEVFAAADTLERITGLFTEGSDIHCAFAEASKQNMKTRSKIFFISSIFNFRFSKIALDNQSLVNPGAFFYADFQRTTLFSRPN